MRAQCRHVLTTFPFPFEEVDDEEVDAEGVDGEVERMVVSSSGGI
jgi:hypothetical protein